MLCNSTQKTGNPILEKHFVQVTHPFHPLHRKQLIFIGKRYNCRGTQILLETDDGVVRSVPQAWTDLAVSDPESAMVEGRSYFRVEDLLDLARHMSILKDVINKGGVENV